MAKAFKGIWGTFEYIDDASTVIETLHGDGKDYSVLSPCPRHELEHAMGDPSSIIPFVTLAFGAMGIFFGYGLTAWMSMDWVLPVSGKPIVSLPAYTIFGFELMVLLGGVATALGILILGYIDLVRKRMPGSPKFKGYKRFSNDRFGVVVRCDESQAGNVEKLMKAYNVEEVVREF